MVKIVTACLFVWVMLAFFGCCVSQPPVAITEKGSGKMHKHHFPETVADGAALVVVYNNKNFFEGPTWDPKTNKLYFTAWGGDKQQVLRLDAPGKATVWMDDTAGINGTFRSKTGRLLTAEVYAHQLCSYRIGVDESEDKKILAYNDSWHQPNDLCQTSRGDIYFTDPNWTNKKTSSVYLLSPSGIVTKVIDDMSAPNGIITSSDDSLLYVGDSKLKLWRCYPINADGSIGLGKTFFNPSTENDNAPDGMTIDILGNLYFTGRGGVWVVKPNGTSLGLIEIPEFASNVTFGGRELKTLYVTCQSKVYCLEMAVRGR